MTSFSKGIFAGVFSLLCLSTHASAFGQLAAKDLDMGPWMNCASPDDNGLYFSSDKMKVVAEDQHEKKYTFDGHAVHIGKRDLVVEGHKLIEGNKVWISSESSDWPAGCPEGGLLKPGGKPAAPAAPSSPQAASAPTPTASAPTPSPSPAPVVANPVVANPVVANPAASTPAASTASPTDPNEQTAQTALAGTGQCGPGKGGPGPQGAYCGTYSTTGSPWDCRPDASIKSCPFLKLQPFTAP